MRTSDYPLVNGRRFVGMCEDLEEANALASRYYGTVEWPGIKLKRKTVSSGNVSWIQYELDCVVPYAYSIFIDRCLSNGDPPKPIDPKTIRIENDEAIIDPGPLCLRGP